MYQSTIGAVLREGRRLPEQAWLRVALAGVQAAMKKEDVVYSAVPPHHYLAAQPSGQARVVAGLLRVLHADHADLPLLASHFDDEEVTPLPSSPKWPTVLRVMLTGGAIACLELGFRCRQRRSWRR